VLVVLTGFALWAAATTNTAALHAAELTHLNDAYQRARLAVAAEERLAHEYRHQPGPELRAQFQQAARSLDAAVQYLHQHGDEADRDPIATLEADHRRYRQAVHRQFAAVEADDEPQVLALDEEIEPLFERIAADVEEGATHERDETLDGLAALRRQVVLATPIIFGAGLGLLVLFCVVLVGYQRRTEHQAAQNQHQALHDGLTGLPNRTLLRDRIGQAIRQADRELGPMALALLDLDRFKEVNDTLGHHYGDQLLIQVGQRLQATLRAVDTVARLGGDEFAVLLPRIETAEGAVQVARKLQAALHEPFLVEGLSLDVEASIGLALYPDHGNDPEELLQHADIAMYVAKDTHAGFVLFDPTLDQHSPRKLVLLGELRRVIDQHQLLLHYQPKIHAHSGQVLGVEALVRWQHPDHGLIPPAEFIPLAEHTGLIGPLTHYVLDQALRQCHQWRQDGHELAVAVNVSARRLLDLAFPDEVAGLLAHWRVPARLLVVEITESTIMADPTHALEILGRLDRMGVQVAIDDFGTGYSSMAYLKSLPVHELKVDRSFVAQMTSNSRDAVIVRSTVDLGRNLGLRVVAEGVEDQTTWQELDAVGCDAIQGYYISRPVPPEDLITWLQHRLSATPDSQRQH
jgi:diguanylate cyclase